MRVGVYIVARIIFGLENCMLYDAALTVAAAWVSDKPAEGFDAHS